MIPNYYLRKGPVIAAAALITLLAASIGNAGAQDAPTTYKTKCAACHGDSGKGDGPAAKMLKPPPTGFAVSLKGKADDWIAKVIAEGGKGVGEPPMMPAYPTLSADEVKAMVAYVKQLGGQ
jgi:mono/diheme cytochrome c family protein